MNTFTKREMIISAVAIAAIVGVWFYMQSPSLINNGGEDVKKTADQATTTETTGVPTTPSNTVIPPNTTSSAPSTEIVSFATITYTNRGFSPATVSLRLAGGARFINKSSSSLWVTAYAPTKETKTYPGLDQGKSVPSGGMFELNFGQSGVWWYQNLNNKSHIGAIIVIP